MTDHRCEYHRWPDAPAKEAVAREQVVNGSISELSPNLEALRDNPVDTVMPNGKLGRDCSAEDFADMAEWSLRTAAYAIHAAIGLRASTAGCRI
jgi:hypothetical protein